MGLLLFSFLVFVVAAAVVAGFRLCARWLRRRLGWPAKVKPPLRRVWLEEGLVGMVGGFLLLPTFFIIFHWAAGWLWPHFAPRRVASAMFLWAFPVGLASVCLGLWGIIKLKRFYGSGKWGHLHSDGVMTLLMAFLWLHAWFLCVHCVFLGFGIADF